MDVLNGGVDVFRAVRLHVDRHQVRPGVAEPLHIAHRLGDHQMYVQGEGRDGPDGPHHRDADGDVGDKDAVHHVHVDVVGGGDALDVPLQIREIGGEYGRRDFNHDKPLFSVGPAEPRDGPGDGPGRSRIEWLERLRRLPTPRSARPVRPAPPLF